MPLPFTEDLIPTGAADAEMAMLADRHYSRRKRGSGQFLYAAANWSFAIAKAPFSSGGCRKSRVCGWIDSVVTAVRSFAMNPRGVLQMSFSKPSA